MRLMFDYCDIYIKEGVYHQSRASHIFMISALLSIWGGTYVVFAHANQQVMLKGVLHLKTSHLMALSHKTQLQ